LALKESAGQAAENPVHCSATSQTPAADRQTVLEETKESVGQVAEAPVHCSATSQMPLEDRQTVFDKENLQSEVQQNPGWPLLAPRSHSSNLSVTPLPQVQEYRRKVRVSAILTLTGTKVLGAVSFKIVQEVIPAEATIDKVTTKG